MENHLKTGGEKQSFESSTPGSATVSAYCLDVFQELKIRRKHRFVVYKLGEMEIEVEAVGHREQSFISLKKLLPSSDCRYVVFDQEIKNADGRESSKLWLISWFPLNSTPIAKMTYTTGKAGFRDKLTGVFDIQCGSLEDLEMALGLKKEEEDEDNDFEF